MTLAAQVSALPLTCRAELLVAPPQLSKWHPLKGTLSPLTATGVRALL